MNSTIKESIFEKLILVFFLILGLVCLWSSSQIGGIAFDPLGSKALPRSVGTLVIILSLFCLLSSYYKTHKSDQSDTLLLKTLVEVFVVFALAMIYVSCLFILRIPFSFMTLILMPCVAFVLEGKFDKGMMAIALIAGVIIGFGGELLFTRVFFVDLPQIG